MEDLTFFFSLIAIILSVASIILVIIRIGISLGIEFAEKKEVRKMRKKIDKDLKDEWIAELTKFFSRHSKSVEVMNQETITEEIVELGEATRHIQIAPTLLKVLSKMIFDIAKWFVGIIVATILFVLSVWGALSFPDLAEKLTPFPFLLLLILVLGANETRKKIRGYMFLRSQFYELSEKPHLIKAKELTMELEKRELLYS